MRNRERNMFKAESEMGCFASKKSISELQTDMDSSWLLAWVWWIPVKQSPSPEKVGSHQDHNNITTAKYHSLACWVPISQLSPGKKSCSSSVAFGQDEGMDVILSNNQTCCICCNITGSFLCSVDCVSSRSAKCRPGPSTSSETSTACEKTG